MSHTPPVPDTAVSPYPLQKEQSAERKRTKRAQAADAVPDALPETGGNGVRIAVGAAIGSAAIAAALIYYNRSR